MRHMLLRLPLLALLATPAAALSPIRVNVRDLKNNWGEYDYIRDVLEINSKFRSDPRLAAPTLAHELLHILQHAEQIPAEALEMELEAHIVTIRVLDELGITNDGGSFTPAARRRLAMGPAEYIAWMKRQFPGKPLLLGSDLEAVREELEEELNDAEAGLGARPSQRARAHLDWVAADLELVSSAAGRRSYRAFADRVEKLIAAEHRRLAGRHQ